MKITYYVDDCIQKILSKQHVSDQLKLNFLASQYKESLLDSERQLIENQDVIEELFQIFRDFDKENPLGFLRKLGRLGHDFPFYYLQDFINICEGVAQFEDIKKVDDFMVTLENIITKAQDRLFYSGLRNCTREINQSSFFDNDQQ